MGVKSSARVARSRGSTRQVRLLVACTETIGSVATLCLIVSFLAACAPERPASTFLARGTSSSLDQNRRSLRNCATDGPSDDWGYGCVDALHRRGCGNAFPASFFGQLMDQVMIGGTVAWMLCTGADVAMLSLPHFL